MRYLPAAVCIAIGCIALFSPMLANNIQKEMEQDSAFYARCRGLSEGKILLRYALPSAVVTLLPSFCQMLGLCMAGSAIVERVFSLPGLGYLIIDSVLYRDSPVIHATILFLAFSLVMFNILSDILRRICNGMLLRERGPDYEPDKTYSLVCNSDCNIAVFLFGSFLLLTIRRPQIFGTNIYPAAQNIRLEQTISAAASFRVSLKEGKQL